MTQSKDKLTLSINPTVLKKFRELNPEINISVFLEGAMVAHLLKGKGN